MSTAQAVAVITGASRGIGAALVHGNYQDPHALARNPSVLCLAPSDGSHGRNIGNRGCNTVSRLGGFRHWRNSSRRWRTGGPSPHELNLLGESSLPQFFNILPPLPQNPPNALHTKP